jgi:hypothetical protein
MSRRPVQGPLLAAAAFPILVAELFRSARQSVFGVRDFRLRILPGPLNPRRDVVSEQAFGLAKGLCRLGMRRRVTGQLPSDTKGESVQHAHVPSVYVPVWRDHWRSGIMFAGRCQ